MDHIRAFLLHILLLKLNKNKHTTLGDSTSTVRIDRNPFHRHILASTFATTSGSEDDEDDDSLDASKNMLRAAAVALLAATSCSGALTSRDLLRNVPTLPLGLWTHLNELERTSELSQPSHDTNQLHFPSSSRSTLYEAHTFDQLVSHDALVPAPNEGDTFKQRYWFDASFYKPGGPVFLLDGGETSGEDRIPFLEQGSLRLLSEAAGGIGIIFEHRYYGESFPVANLTTDSLRFLTTFQSLQDGVYFAENVRLPGLERVDLHPSRTPWIYLGGSYAGAKAAFARKLFPDTFWGAIASSAVTTAIADYWEYYEPIRLNAPQDCIAQLQNHTTLIDSILSLHSTFLSSRLKSYFGLGGISRDEDFVNALTLPLSTWQARNWDPKVGSRAFFDFCDALTGDSTNTINHFNPGSLEGLLPGMPDLSSFALYADYVKGNIAKLCPPEMTQDACFSNEDYQGDSLKDSPWKSWTYQFCTEWGYFIGAPPDKDQPSIVSRLLTTDYTREICKQAFPRGKLNRVPNFPNVTAINQWGSFDLTFERLAFIDGSEDPWLYATPHSPHAHKRRDTIDKPFKIVPGGVHHWDQNGLPSRSQEPPEIRKIHDEEVGFVLYWLDDWKESRRGRRWTGWK